MSGHEEVNFGTLDVIASGNEASVDSVRTARLRPGGRGITGAVVAVAAAGMAVHTYGADIAGTLFGGEKTLTPATAADTARGIGKKCLELSGEDAAAQPQTVQTQQFNNGSACWVVRGKKGDMIAATVKVPYGIGGKGTLQYAVWRDDTGKWGWSATSTIGDTTAVQKAAIDAGGQTSAEATNCNMKGACMYPYNEVASPAANSLARGLFAQVDQGAAAALQAANTAGAADS
ncbi:MAG TPA: hypothetical protein VMY99_04750 [Nevskiaceae bacterium]|nr:hypothetical protein [Nevskiaceae bacterium]